MKRISIIILLLPFLSFNAISQQVYITQSLSEQVSKNKTDETIRILVTLNEQLAYYKLKQEFNSKNLTSAERAKFVLNALKKQQQFSQKEFEESLSTFQKENPNKLKVITKYWIANMLLVEASPSAIEYLAQKSEVRYLDYANNKITLIEPEYVGIENPTREPGIAEDGLKAINADAMWALGYTGKGQVVYSYDTGVEPKHPAIDEAYLGNYLPATQCWYPYTSDVPTESASNHGTHTVGTVLGLDEATNDTIGVAFNAYWIGNDLVTSTVEALPSISDMVLAMEWALNPDGDLQTVDDIPDVINNSWRWYDGDDTQYCEGFVVDMLNSLELAGIATIFSGGNSGPNNTTVNSPQRTKTSLLNSFCVGAVDGYNNTFPITSFSTLGPSQCTASDPLNIHPEVVAPGYQVRSCVGLDSYSVSSGTSMSSPHVSGAVLLLKEAFPDLTGETLLAALYYSAIDLGEPGEDNIYGRGMIDVHAAFVYLSQTYTPTLPANDYDISIANVQVENCIDNISPIVEVKNTGQNSISNFSLTFSIDGNNIQTYEHTSELAVGSSVMVSLDAHNLTQYGNYKINLSVEIDELLPELDKFNNLYHQDYHYINIADTFNEGFENEELPLCWTSVIEEGSNPWRFNSNYTVAHSGNHFAYLKKSGIGNQVSKMVTHQLDLTSFANPTLNFWHKQKKSFSFQDELFIYYKNSGTGEWQLIDIFDLEVTDWTQQSISLPNTSNDYYIAFEGQLNEGQGICVDDVTIDEAASINHPRQNFEIYPNPTTGVLFIKNDNNTQKNATINIFNILGKKVYSEKMNLERVSTINFSSMKGGAYFIEININSYSYKQQFILIK